MNRTITKGSGLALLAVFAFSLACDQSPSASNQTPVAATPATTITPPSTPAQPTPQNPEDLMPRIRADEAVRLVRNNEAIVLDVRGTEAYKTSHIKGAIDYPLERLEKSDFKGLPRDKKIISYCT
jgi:hypothetical protein